jgi:hypothetical protein
MTKPLHLTYVRSTRSSCLLFLFLALCVHVHCYAGNLTVDQKKGQSEDCPFILYNPNKNERLTLVVVA